MVMVSGSRDMDYGLNFSLSNFFSTQAKRKMQRHEQHYHLSTPDWRSFSVSTMLSRKPFSSAPRGHFSDCRKPSAERLMNDSYQFQKRNSAGVNQVPYFGQYRSNAASMKDTFCDAKLPLSSGPYCNVNLNRRQQNNHLDKYCVQSSHCKPLLQPPEKLSRSNLSFADMSLEDDGTDKTSHSLSTLVNQLLDDPVVDIKGAESSAPPSHTDWSLENESIGEMAIKLADLALLDEIVSKPVVKTNVQGDDKGPNICVQVNFMAQVRKASKAKPVTEDINPKGNHNRKKSPSYFSSMKNRVSHYEKMGTYPQRCTVNTFESKRFKESPKNAPWNGSRMRPESTYFKVGADSTFSRNAGTKAKHSDSHWKAKSPAAFKEFRGVKTWTQLQAMDSKSDSSMSSNDVRYGYKESGIHRSSAGAFKYNSFSKPKGQGDDLFQEMQRSQRPRKSFSSSSNSSSSGGRYKHSECVFCKTNGETAEMYRSHVLKDEQGHTVCQVLQQYVCPLCGATGINAHTVKYCPQNQNPPPVATMTTLKSMRSSTGRKRFGPCSGQIRQTPFHFNQYLLPA